MQEQWNYLCIFGFQEMKGRKRSGTVAAVGKFLRNASCVAPAASGSAERFQKVNRFLSH